MKRQLIIGVVKGYSYRLLQGFLLSLRQVNYRGDLCMFLSENLGQRTKRILIRQGVKIIEFKESSPFLEGLEPLATGMPAVMSINNYRYLLYYSYLMQHRDAYDQVMISDVRDVVFQRDPFAFEMDNNLCCFLETKSIQIKDSDINRDWLDAVAGEAARKTIQDQYISCSGITYGPTDAMLQYLEAFLEHLKKVPVAEGGTDQGIHNYLIYTHKINNLRLFDNESGPVLTMHFMDEYRVNDQGLVCNEQGRAVNVIHQYDRHPALAQRYLQQYHGGKVKDFVDKVTFRLFR